MNGGGRFVGRGRVGLRDVRDAQDVRDRPKGTAWPQGASRRGAVLRKGACPARPACLARPVQPGVVLRVLPTYHLGHPREPHLVRNPRG